MAMKLMQHLLRFCQARLETSKEVPAEQFISQQIWNKIVSTQYNLYSRLESGAMVAGNGILLLQLRSMFMAFMMSCKLEAAGNARGRSPQVMARAWLGMSPFP
jgi:hypothetical protein